MEVHAGVPAALAIALRAGKAVAARALAAPSGTQSVRFSDLGADEVEVSGGTRFIAHGRLCVAERNHVPT